MSNSHIVTKDKIHSRSFISQDDIHIYFNASLYNNTGETGTPTLIPANFRQQRTENILDNSTDYCVSVEKFTIPIGQIPIFQFQRNTYGISLRSYAAGVPIDEQSDFVDYTGDFSTQPNDYVFHALAFISMVNQKLIDLFALLAKGAGAPTTPPFFIFEPEHQLFSIIYETGYDRRINPDRIDVYFNSALYGKFFDNLPAIFRPNLTAPFIPTHRDFQLFLSSATQFTWDIDPTLKKMQQEGISLDNWTDLRAIAIVANSTELKKDYLGANENFNTQLLDEKRAIWYYGLITVNSLNDVGGIYSYEADHSVYTDIQTSQPLSSIDFEIYWVDQRGRFNLLEISSGRSINVQFAFKKKNYL